MQEEYVELRNFLQSEDLRIMLRSYNSVEAVCRRLYMLANSTFAATSYTAGEEKFFLFGRRNTVMDGRALAYIQFHDEFYLFNLLTLKGKETVIVQKVEPHFVFAGDLITERAGNSTQLRESLLEDYTRAYGVGNHNNDKQIIADIHQAKEGIFTIPGSPVLIRASADSRNNCIVQHPEYGDFLLTYTSDDSLHDVQLWKFSVDWQMLHKFIPAGKTVMLDSV